MSSRRFAALTCRLAFVLALGASTVPCVSTAIAAPESAAAESTAASAPAANGFENRLASPQTTLRTLIEEVAAGRAGDAALTLDLSTFDSVAAARQAPQLATRLKTIIEHMGPVPFDRVPADRDFDQPYSLAWDTQSLTTDQRADATRIIIARGRDGLWRFSPRTVAEIDRLWTRWGTKPAAAAEAHPFATKLRNLFPERLHETRFLLADYQWLGLIAIGILAFLTDRGSRAGLQYLTAAWFRFMRTEAQRESRRELWKPIGLFVQTIVWYAGTMALGLPPGVMTVVMLAIKFVAVVAAVLVSFRLIDVLAGYVASRALLTASKVDDLLVPLLSKSLKVVVTCVGAVVCAEAFSLPVTGLLGGLGLGGAALALASKDAVANVFGSVSLLTDRPFEIGDWVVVDGVEGHVEEVGFRSTRIRSLHHSLVTLPNSRLTTAIVDNLGRRRFRRVRMTLPLAYDTSPRKLEAFCEGVRELIRRHASTRKDLFHVCLYNYSEKSLDVLVECFLVCPDLTTELRERDRLLLDMLRLAETQGVLFFATPRPPVVSAPTDKPESDPSAARTSPDANLAGPHRMAQTSARNDHAGRS